MVYNSIIWMKNNKRMVGKNRRNEKKNSCNPTDANRWA